MDQPITLVVGFGEACGVSTIHRVAQQLSRASHHQPHGAHTILQSSGSTFKNDCLKLTKVSKLVLVIKAAEAVPTRRAGGGGGGPAQRVDPNDNDGGAAPRTNQESTALPNTAAYNALWEFLRTFHKDVVEEEICPFPSVQIILSKGDSSKTQPAQLKTDFCTVMNSTLKTMQDENLLGGLRPFGLSSIHTARDMHRLKLTAGFTIAELKAKSAVDAALMEPILCAFFPSVETTSSPLAALSPSQLESKLRFETYIRICGADPAKLNPTNPILQPEDTPENMSGTRTSFIIEALENAALTINEQHISGDVLQHMSVAGIEKRFADCNAGIRHVLIAIRKNA